MQALFSILLSLAVLAWILSRIGKLFTPQKNSKNKKRHSAFGIVFWLILERVFPFLSLFAVYSGLKSAFKRGWGEKGEESQQEAFEHTGNGMSKDEARRILGVDPNASKQDIKDAYKRLMLRNHPDGGGTDYLAQKINEARDALLKR